MALKIANTVSTLLFAVCLAVCSDVGAAIISCPQGVEIFDHNYDSHPRLSMFAECKHLKHLPEADIRCQISKQLIIQAGYGSVVQYIRSQCVTAAQCHGLRQSPGYSPEDGALIRARTMIGCCQPHDLACIRRLVDL
uniref:Secreted protein n=1 Tax=Macrostomum lignano TaxID=282301 RepID=A0A1I8ITI6_9PLAT